MHRSPVLSPQFSVFAREDDKIPEPRVRILIKCTRVVYRADEHNQSTRSRAIMLESFRRARLLRNVKSAGHVEDTVPGVPRQVFCDRIRHGRVPQRLRKQHRRHRLLAGRPMDPGSVRRDVRSGLLLCSALLSG